jgi:hypothetical protein
VVILAGYEDRMDEFFRLNPGMSSRIAHHIDFPDCTIDELERIATLMLSAECYELSAGAGRALHEWLERRMAQPRFAHARSVRNAIERARLRHANRVYADAVAGRSLTVQDLMRIEEADIRAASRLQLPRHHRPAPRAAAPRRADPQTRLPPSGRHLRTAGVRPARALHGR